MQDLIFSIWRFFSRFIQFVSGNCNFCGNISWETDLRFKVLTCNAITRDNNLFITYYEKLFYVITTD